MTETAVVEVVIEVVNEVSGRSFFATNVYYGTV